ncbi:hypothetical protein QAD02_011013 [Eretmocerus hayati]|uniref:Uncharacterized protein n=1 Tax=Eretmocerus hayati TaxID=131215 RepID=A0ACC2NVV0_9HYME|nr:hypothetical protein QAD02_011013 [Eretmocerus hayati]
MSCPGRSQVPLIHSRSGRVEREVMIIYKWLIDKSVILDTKIGEAIISPRIKLSDTKQCIISLYPRGRNENWKDFASIHLGSVMGEYEVNFRFHILNVAGDIVAPTEYSKHVLKKDAPWCGYNNFIENKVLENLMAIKNVNGCVPSTLTIVCEFIIDTEFEKKSILLSQNGSQLGDLNSFEQYIDNKQFSDVILLVDGKKMHAHKNILANSSEVFAAMFTHNIKENGEAVVDIDDISYDVMKQLLGYVYARKVDNLEKMATDLFVAADKYLITGLRKMCEDHLIQNIKCENVFEYLNFASSYNASALKHSGMNFFKSNIKEVMNQSNVKLYELDKNIIDEVYDVLAKSLKA